jgi:hypothetical protein
MRPVGWRYESVRHGLAAKGIKSRSYNVVNWRVEEARRAGHVVWMPPGKYLKLTGAKGDEYWLEEYHDTEERRSLPIGMLKEKMEDGKQISIPFMYGYGSQEGRHRAHAAKIVGEKVIPVLVESPAEKVNDDVAEEFINRSGFNNDESYSNEWRSRFKRGYPDQYMDNEHKKIYKDILSEKGLTKKDVRGEGFIVREVEGGEEVQL